MGTGQSSCLAHRRWGWDGWFPEGQPYPVMTGPLQTSALWGPPVVRRFPSSHSGMVSTQALSVSCVCHSVLGSLETLEAGNRTGGEVGSFAALA